MGEMLVCGVGGGQQFLCVKEQYHFYGWHGLKKWNIRIAVLYFDDRLRCILTRLSVLWCSSGK